MTRLKKVIEEVKAIRKVDKKHRAWIYDDDGNISEDLICGDVLPFLEELQGYEINATDEFIERFIKGSYSLYTYNNNANVDSNIVARYKEGCPIICGCIHLYGDARQGFGSWFVVKMDNYYDNNPITQFLQLESAEQYIDINDRYTADVNIFSETYSVYDREKGEDVGTYFGIEKSEVLAEIEKEVVA